MTAGKKFKRLVRDRAQRTGESYASARRQLLRQHASEESMSDDRLVEVRAVRVAASGPEKAPCLLLEEVNGNRTLPIFVGPAEGTAIEFALQALPTKRPMTHDALKQAVDALGARVRQIVIGFQPDERMYTADVILEVRDAGERRLDWRVSDSVALAVRCDPPPPILVPESLFTTAPPSSPWGSGWPRRIQLRCSCDAWILVEEFEAADPAVPEVEVNLTCPACGAEQQYRIRRP